jgi:hypothetical protein
LTKTTCNTALMPEVKLSIRQKIAQGISHIEGIRARLVISLCAAGAWPRGQGGAGPLVRYIEEVPRNAVSADVTHVRGDRRPAGFSLCEQ